jgi:hypothetical protein
MPINACSTHLILYQMKPAPKFASVSIFCFDIPLSENVPDIKNKLAPVLLLVFRKLNILDITQLIYGCKW